jgi:hypothetical protein
VKKTVIFNYKKLGQISKLDLKNEFKNCLNNKADSASLLSNNIAITVLKGLQKMQIIQIEPRQADIVAKGVTGYHLPSQLLHRAFSRNKKASRVYRS